MVDKFSLQWDRSRPILREVLSPGVWTNEDDQSYLALLKAELGSAPTTGFDFLSDARQYTMQAERPNDQEIYEAMARAGCRRLVQVGAKSVLGLQTARVLRSSGANVMTHLTCATMAEAETLFR